MNKVYRVAVCLSGQLRTWDYCKQNIKEYFEDVNKMPKGYSNLQVDYYIHSWADNRSFFGKDGSTLKPHDKTDMLNENEFDKVIEYYKPKRYLIEKPLPKHEYDWASYVWRGLMHSFCRSIEIKSDYEDENLFEYDCVIKARFDMIYEDRDSNPFVYETYYLKETIHNDFNITFMAEQNRKQIQDVLFWGSSYAMDRLAKCYHWYMVRTGRDIINAKKTLIRKQHPASKISAIDDIGFYGTAIGPGAMMLEYMKKHSLLGWHDNSITFSIVRDAAVIYDYKDPVERRKMQDLVNKSHIREFSDAVAIFFDLDGVLFDSNLYHKQALITAIEKLYNVNIFEKDIDGDSMLSTSHKINIIKEKYNIDINEVDVLKAKDSIFEEMVRDHQDDGCMLTMFEKLSKHNIKIGLLSNSRRKNINMVLNKLNIKEYFDIVLSGQEDVERPKPFSDILYKAYEKLEIYNWDRHKTVLIEDTDEGARAGYASPSSVIKVESPKDVCYELILQWISKK